MLVLAIIPTIQARLLMTYFLPILSVFIGFLIALFLKPKNSLGLKLLLAFSGSYLLSITVFEFLPEIYNSGKPHVGVFIMGGILLQIILEFFSRGAEHGHLHKDELITKIPWLLFISLFIHALIEGFPLHNRTHLLHGVVLHKIPVAIILSSFLLNSKIQKSKSILFLLFFAIMTPIGSWISQISPRLMDWEPYINAIVVGIFLHISTTILFEASRNHKFNAAKLATIIVGILIAYFV